MDILCPSGSSFLFIFHIVLDSIQISRTTFFCLDDIPTTHDGVHLPLGAIVYPKGLTGLDFHSTYLIRLDLLEFLGFTFVLEIDLDMPI